MAVIQGAEFDHIDLKQKGSNDATRHMLKDAQARQGLDDVSGMIAPTEASATASMAHAVGDYFILGDTLYVATAAIAAGAEIVTSGSEANCRAAVLGNEVSAVKNEVSAVKNAVDSLAVENVSPVTGWVQGNIIESNGQSQGTGSVTYEKTVRIGKKLVAPDYVSVEHPDTINIRLFVYTDTSDESYTGAQALNDGDLTQLAGKYIRMTAAYAAGGTIAPADVAGLIAIVSAPAYTDPSLSMEGKAADAKAAGDAIAGFESDLETGITQVETEIARVETELTNAVGSKANAPTANASGSIISITGMAENSTLGKLDLSMPYDANGYSAFDITCTGKNLFGGRTMMNKIYDVSSPKATKNETAGTIKFAGSSVNNKKFFTAFKPNVQYTFIFDVEESGSNGYANMKLWYTDGTNDFITIEKTTSRQTVRVVSKSGKSVESLRGSSITGSTTLYVDTCGVFEGVVSAEEFAEYSGQTFSFTPAAALYGGDFDALTGVLTSRYNASGEELDPPTTESLTPISYLFRQDSGCVWASAGTLDIEYRQSVDGYVADYVDGAIAALNPAPIIVAPSGGDYSSFTQAVYEHRSDTYAEFVVKPGTYDIVAEYVALFGQETVDTLADATDLSGFQYGIRVNNKKITFESGSHLVCDWTGHTVNSTHRFCAFSVGRNSELIGMDLDCTATFYAIHDDYGLTDRYYENIYRNCRVIGHGITNQNLIGGGCKPYSKHVIDNCYFDNGTSEGACVRYHNTNLANAEPVIWVSNSYFAQALTFRYYGSQTTKMRAYVNNCRASYINKGAEGSATVDNVELYAWNNETGA